jgi:hypothetical protein
MGVRLPGRGKRVAKRMNKQEAAGKRATGKPGCWPFGIVVAALAAGLLRGGK